MDAQTFVDLDQKSMQQDKVKVQSGNNSYSFKRCFAYKEMYLKLQL